MPAIVTTGRVFHHQPPSLWTFLPAGFEPGISGVHLVCSPPKLGALTTRPSCCPKGVYASHSNDGTCFLLPSTQPMNFFGSGIQPRHIRRIFKPFFSKARSLNHSAILLPRKFGLRLPQLQGDVTRHRPSPVDFLWQRDSNPAYPAYI